jgi:RND superfamily putative drug exporter
MITALVVDVTIVRAVLVPATMRLLGRANWWAPGPLRRFYSRYGIKEGDTGTGADRPLGDTPPRLESASA